MATTSNGCKPADTPRSKYDAVARQHLSANELDRYYERSGIYQHDAGYSEADADMKAYYDIVGKHNKEQA